MKRKIIMHVNFTEQGQSYEYMCKKAKEWGYDGIEFRSKNMQVEQSNKEYLETISSAVDKAKLDTVVFGGPGGDFTNFDKDIREKELEHYIDFYTRAGDMFDLKVCNCMGGVVLGPNKVYSEYENNGSFAATEEQFVYSSEAYKELGKVAINKDFKLAFEVHMCYIHDTPKSAKKLVDMIDCSNVGLNLDYGNVSYFTNAPALKDTINLIGDKLFYVHLKNSAVVGNLRIKTALSQGDINNREFINILNEKEYDGFLCIEAPRPGDREWYAQEDLDYLKKVIETV